ncbi:protein FREE1-like [Silene latifolia]|uniref:protein FREE1-like n=1 Tax=Silene latifolia TaxID=37657 RepID=UPI003D770082
MQQPGVGENAFPTNNNNNNNNSYYPHYDHQHNPQPPFFQNPNPNFTPNSIDPYQSHYPASSASAPPLSSSYAPPDYPNYPSSYPQFPDHTLHNPYPNPNPNPQFHHDHTPPPYFPHDHDPNPNPNPNLTVPHLAPQYSGYDDRWDRSQEYGHGFGNGGGGGEDEGVYRYEGGKAEPYGARGTSGFSKAASNQVMFDDYGRPISVANGNGDGKRGGSEYGGVKTNKVVKAVPKEDTEEDFRGGIQKFRVKLLAEGYGQTDMDVLCQIGLDGIQMLDPATSRTLRIYPFEAVTRWEVLDSCIFAFWAKTPADFEAKRIRLKSSSYTTTTILDTVTAASVQLQEIAEGKVPNSSRTAEQLAEKKKGFDWMNLVKPPIEEKEHWVPDEAVNKCSSCGSNFNAFVRRHHCRNCGEIFCDKCTQGRTPLTLDEDATPVRVCDRCMAEVTQRLDNAKEAVNRSGAMLSHEDLAKKLKDEMNRNSKATSGSRFEGSETRKREVECPTCTVHLQVEVPSSGSETIECSVCQHPFLVSAH